MIIFEGKITPDPKNHADLPNLMKIVTEDLDKKLRMLTCPQHPNHNHHVILEFSMRPGFGLHIMNSCCKEFPVLLSKNIHEAMNKRRSEL